QTWLAWKKQKGIDVDVQVVASNASANTVKNLIYARYALNHPTFLVLVGDETVVTNYSLWDYESSYGLAASDLEYASVDGDVYHDMFMSRMPVSTVEELGNLVSKTLTYEQYTMSDPSYLDNVLLIAGADDYWARYVGRPTINYAADNYFNTEHGFANVYKYVTNTYTGCYNYLNTGVGFANYTAHGDIQMWYSPQFTNDNVNSLTNDGKYFWAIGNCCLTANFKNAQNNKLCLGEAMVRAADKGAFGYIGSVPESYWYEDYYFGVGATNTFKRTPAMSATTTGIYDAMFDDTGFNTLNAVPFVGNLAVSYAHANHYESSISDEYYWRAYQCFGDGSVMPYLSQPSANQVNHAGEIILGANAFTVSADPGSYVSITKDGEILGVAVVPDAGIVDVPVSGLYTLGSVMVVVTRQQRQPHIATIQAKVSEGPFISLNDYTPSLALVGEDAALSLTFKNVGIDATVGTTAVTLTSSDAHVTIVDGTGTFSALAVDATTTLSSFLFRIDASAALGIPVLLHY
ncbi:MAG: C25 family cysteine peptidase, partial [Prevotella sp.]